MAASTSSSVLSSDARNAAAAPWNVVWTLAGMPISACACSIAATALPSDAPGARLNDIVTAGNWPAWLITSWVLRSRIVARLDSGTWRPSDVATNTCPSASGPTWKRGSISSTTRYWLACV